MIRVEDDESSSKGRVKLKEIESYMRTRARMRIAFA